MASDSGESPIAVYGAIASNFLIAVAKFVAAFSTGSSSMRSELHRQQLRYRLHGRLAGGDSPDREHEVGVRTLAHDPRPRFISEQARHRIRMRPIPIDAIPSSAGAAKVTSSWRRTRLRYWESWWLSSASCWPYDSPPPMAKSRMATIRPQKYNSWP